LLEIMVRVLKGKSLETETRSARFRMVSLTTTPLL